MGMQCSAVLDRIRYKKTTAGKWNHRYFMLNDAKLLHYFPMSQYGHLDAVDTPKGTIALDGTVIQQHVRSRAQSVRPVGPSPFAMCSVPCAGAVALGYRAVCSSDKHAASRAAARAHSLAVQRQ